MDAPELAHNKDKCLVQRGLIKKVGLIVIDLGYNKDVKLDMVCGLASPRTEKEFSNLCNMHTRFVYNDEMFEGVS